MKSFRDMARPDITWVHITLGDITQCDVDVIVNATNPTLNWGSGVNGAILKAGGPLLYEECKALGGCKVAEAKITNGHDLPAKYVIHTVGPTYGWEEGEEANLLFQCYLNSIKLAHQHKLKSIAFPAISAGGHGFPLDEAGEVVAQFLKHLQRSEPDVFNWFEQIIFVLHSEEEKELFEKGFNNKFEAGEIQEHASADEINIGLPKHDFLPDDIVYRIVEFKRILREVETIPLHETIDNFRFDRNPEKELQAWESMAHVYKEYLDLHPGLDLQEKKEIYKKILKASLDGNPITVRRIEET